MLSEKIAYETSLQLAECRDRLEIACVPDNPLARLHKPAGTVLCRLRGPRIRLYATGPPFLNNFMAPYFFGAFERRGKRTILRGKFAPHWWVRVFVAVWTTMLCAIGGVLIILGFATLLGVDVKWEGNIPVALIPWLAILMPPAMLTFGYALVRFGRWLGEKQQRLLDQLLCETLEAHRLTKP